MRARPFLSVLLLALAVSLTASAQRPEKLDDAQEARRTKLVAALKPGVRPKLEPAVQAVLKQASAPPPTKPGAAAPDLGAVAKAQVKSSVPDGDTETLAYLVLLEAARSAQEDLRSTMESVKALKRKQAAIRASQAARQQAKTSGRPCAKLECVPASTEYARADLDALVDETKGDLDGMNDLGEMVSLRLQVKQDRLSKVMSTLSNILKKASDTSSTIIANPK